LVSVCFRTSQYTHAWITVEPYSQNSDIVFQGWDSIRNKFWTWRFNEIIDIVQESGSYVPISNRDWEWRIRESEVEFTDEPEVRQTKGLFINYRRKK